MMGTFTSDDQGKLIATVFRLLLSRHSTSLVLTSYDYGSASKAVDPYETRSLLMTIVQPHEA